MACVHNCALSTMIFNTKYLYTQVVICNYFLSDEFSEVMKKTVLHNKIPFDMNGGFVKLYFGRDKKRAISYAEFSQFLHVNKTLCS